MSDSGQVSGEHIRHPEVQYERRDLSARAVITFFISLAIAGVFVQVLVWAYFKYLGRSQYAGRPTTNPIMTSSRQLEEIGGDPAVNFPAPRLQPDPPADLNKFREREEQILNSYGWVDQKAGTVHIPIERAIDMLANSGLPVRQAAPGQKVPAAQSESVLGAALSSRDPASKQ